MIYVAASSREIDRAKAVIKKLRDNGIAVTSTWPEQILNVGEANPADATKYQRAIWASNCLREVSESTVLWLLHPPKGVPTQGAYVEYGFALALATANLVDDKHTPRTTMIMVSGDTTGTVFPALVEEFKTDDEAFKAIEEIFDKVKDTVVKTLRHQTQLAP